MKTQLISILLFLGTYGLCNAQQDSLSLVSVNESAADAGKAQFEQSSRPLSMQSYHLKRLEIESFEGEGFGRYSGLEKLFAYERYESRLLVDKPAISVFVSIMLERDFPKTQRSFDESIKFRFTERKPWRSVTFEDVAYTVGFVAIIAGCMAGYGKRELLYK